MSFKVIMLIYYCHSSQCVKYFYEALPNTGKKLINIIKFKPNTLYSFIDSSPNIMPYSNSNS